MSSNWKTVQAKSLPLRVAFGYAPTPADKPVMATAYKRGGAIIIATVGVAGAPGVVEYRPTDKVRYAPVPEAVGTRGLRYCRTCPETHLLRVGADAYATLFCDVRTAQRNAAYKAAKDEGRAWPTKSERAEAHRERVAEKIDTIIATAAPSRERMIAATLTNVATSTAYADEEKRARRFAALAAQYGLSVEQAEALVAKHAA